MNKILFAISALALSASQAVAKEPIDLQSLSEFENGLYSFGVCSGMFLEIYDDIMDDKIDLSRFREFPTLANMITNNIATRDRDPTNLVQAGMLDFDFRVLTEGLEVDVADMEKCTVDMRQFVKKEYQTIVSE